MTVTTGIPGIGSIGFFFVKILTILLGKESSHSVLGIIITIIILTMIVHLEVLLYNAVAFLQIKYMLLQLAMEF